MLSATARRHARTELRSIGRYCRRTGADPVEMIEVPPDIREDLEAFCAAHPEDEVVRRSLDIRDYMLSCIEGRAPWESQRTN
jgi:hypothetical protein